MVESDVEIMNDVSGGNIIFWIVRGNTRDINDVCGRYKEEISPD